MALHNEPAYGIVPLDILGDPVSLVMNSIPIVSDEDWELQEYRINFNPNVEKNIKEEMMIKHKTFLREYVFVKSNKLYSFLKYDRTKCTFYEHDPSGLLVTITIHHKRSIGYDDIQRTPILHKFFQNCLKYSEFVPFGSQYCDLEATTTNSRLGLQHCPGFEFDIGDFDLQVTLRIELTCKFKAAETVLDFLRVNCGNKRKRNPSLMKNFESSIIGIVVLTTYNHTLYKILGVDESLNINSTFINEDGSRISYKDYYKQKWNISISDDKQPMLRTRKHKNGNGTLYLVPELCTITGLTDIGNKHLVKELSQYTNYGPNKNINKYNQLISKLSCTPKFIEALNSWNFHLSRNFLRIPGRVLPSIDLKSRTNIFHANQGNWSGQLEFMKMLITPRVDSWVVLTPQTHLLEVKKFVENLREVARRMELYLPIPEIIQMNDIYQRTYMKHLNEIVNNNSYNFILCVIRSLHSGLYNKINRKLCIEAAVPSQLVSLKQITMNDLSMYRKTSIRINCKLGGVPWSVTNLNLENIMVIGLSTYQDLNNKHKYFCAVMASMDKSCTRYFSFVESLSEENISEFFASSITKALGKYRDKNHMLPSGMLIYRDCLKYHTTRMPELDLIVEKCRAYCEVRSLPLSYILISKSCETKFFSQCGPFNYRNPQPGTIVDHYVTNQPLDDFFLISHTVKSGTVQPTYYRILFNSIPYFSKYQIYMYTYLCTHMHFNYLHTIRFPAPYQLACDLAYFSANTLKSTQNISLHGTPFFF